MIFSKHLRGNGVLVIARVADILIDLRSRLDLACVTSSTEKPFAGAAYGRAGHRHSPGRST
jgi:hypothetical protein